MSNKDSFNYTYSAKEQEEIKNIRMKYTAPVREDKMEQLRRLDKRVSSKAAVVALTVGIIGTLVMGTGMSLVMTDIGATVGIDNNMLIGIVIGIIGMLMAIVNYPIYKSILASRKEKYAERILKLSEKIMNNK